MTDNATVRVTIETTDAGTGTADDLRWMAEWLGPALRDSPFYIESVRIEVVSGESAVEVYGSEP